MADTESVKFESVEKRPQQSGRREGSIRNECSSGRMADTENNNGRLSTGQDGQEDSQSFGCDEINRPSTIDNSWRDADWLFCRDGKWRPIEPGTFPLAHGIPGRVGLLRGYGNAINPYAAAEFIKVFTKAAINA